MKYLVVLVLLISTQSIAILYTCYHGSSDNPYEETIGMVYNDVTNCPLVNHKSNQEIVKQNDKYYEADGSGNINHPLVETKEHYQGDPSCRYTNETNDL